MNVTWLLLFAVWCVALFSTPGVRVVGEVLRRSPCNLCWGQRAVVFPFAVVPGNACWRGTAQVLTYALPFAAIVAAFHLALYWNIDLLRVRMKEAAWWAMHVHRGSTFDRSHLLRQQALRARLVASQ